MTTGFKKFLCGLRGRALPCDGGVTFVHKSPKHGNIGDYLCSPRHYFEFSAIKENVKILGGGAYKNFGLDKLSKEGWAAEDVILWGVGNSSPLERWRDTPLIESMPYVAWGVRDIDALVDVSHFLPCVSCLHPRLDAMNSDSGVDVLLFMNIDSAVTSQEDRKALDVYAKQKGWRLVFNNCSENVIWDEIAGAKEIITNSYHGTYWGLLAGRRVACLGYSSKFRSVLSGMGLDCSLLIECKKGGGVVKAIETAGLGHNWNKLETPAEVLRDYRRKNIDFAENLYSMGLCKAVPRCNLVLG